MYKLWNVLVHMKEQKTEIYIQLGNSSDINP